MVNPLSLFASYDIGNDVPPTLATLAGHGNSTDIVIKGRDRTHPKNRDDVHIIAGSLN